MRSTGRMAFLSIVAGSILAITNFISDPASAEDIIKIGTPLALTGGLADEGKKQQIAYDMWLRRVNGEYRNIFYQLPRRDTDASP